MALYIEDDTAVFDDQWNCLQGVTCAGPGDAFPRIDNEQCAMRSALYERVVEIKKLVFLPVKINAGVWALIVISEKLSILMHHKNIAGLSLYFQLKTFAAGVFDIGCFAENVCHVVW